MGYENETLLERNENMANIILLKKVDFGHVSKITSLHNLCKEKKIDRRLVVLIDCLLFTGMLYLHFIITECKCARLGS